MGYPLIKSADQVHGRQPRTYWNLIKKSSSKELIETKNDKNVPYKVLTKCKYILL